MKLAEALILRAANNRRIDELQRRIVGGLWVQEETPPAEDIESLVSELEKLCDDQTVLIRSINRTNSLTKWSNFGLTISDLISNRDWQRTRNRIFSAIANQLRANPGRVSKSEIKFFKAFDLQKMNALVDDSARFVRELDTELQSANWQVDLID